MQVSIVEFINLCMQIRNYVCMPVYYVSYAYRADECVYISHLWVLGWTFSVLFFGAYFFCE